MNIGVPREVKNNEFRVALTPAGARELVNSGHAVSIEAGAGLGSAIRDEDFQRVGAKIISSPDELWSGCDLILKVKEPIASEYSRMRSGQVLFTYLHLAASRECTDALLSSGITAIAYETVEVNGTLPLLAPMSEVAGRMAPQVGAAALQKSAGGRGVLLGGVPGVGPGKVLVIGGGTAGLAAATIAHGMRAKVTVVDTNQKRLQEIDQIFGGAVTTLMSSAHVVEEEALQSDLIIGAVLVHGAKAPKLISRPTTHAEPTFKVHNSVFYCVANMPGAVPFTSTYALSNATLKYTLALANLGWREALRADAGLALGLNTHEGKIYYEAVGAAHGIKSHKWTF